MERVENILLVDDDKIDNYFNKLMLEEMQLARNIHLAYNGNDALDLVHMLNGNKEKQAGASLILLDIHMPEMNGFEFLEKLTLTNINAESLRIVFLTSSIDSQNVERAKQYDFVSYIRKPLTKEKIKLIFKEMKENL